MPWHPVLYGEGATDALSHYGPESDTDRGEVLGGPLWSRIPAVEAGEVHELDDDLLSGIGIQAAQEILDRFEEDLSRDRR